MPGPCFARGRRGGLSHAARRRRLALPADRFRRDHRSRLHGRTARAPGRIRYVRRRRFTLRYGFDTGSCRREAIDVKRITRKRRTDEPCRISRKRDRSLAVQGDYHRRLALLAAQQAARVLSYFEAERPDDLRPRRAIEAIQAWASGRRKLGMADVRKLALGAHAAARACKSKAAMFAARAAGHAVATWHVPTHAMGVPIYVCKAILAAHGITKPFVL